MDISPIFINLLGFVATAVAIVMWVPQARITWNNRNDAVKLAGVSETTQWMAASSYLLWGVFGAVSESFWVMAPSLVSFPLSIATILVIHRGRRLAPLTKSVSVIPMSMPLSESAPTASILAVEIAPVPIMSMTPTGSIEESNVPAATSSIPILSTATSSIPILSTATSSIPILSTATSPAQAESPYRSGAHPASGAIPVPA